MPRGRAANGSGTQPRLRPDGRWEIRYTAGIDPGTGKLIRKSLYGRTSEEVARKLRGITAAVDAGTWQEPKRMPLAEWLDTWLAEYCIGVKPSTLKTYSDVVKNHIKPALGAVLLCDLQPHEIQRFLNSLQRGVKPLSPKSVKNVHGVLSKALAEAVRIKYLPMNPSTGCILPKVTRDEIHPFESEEITRFMEGIKCDPFEPLFFVAINTGMRISELLGLRWSRVDFKKGTIKVDAQLLCLRGAGSKRTLGPTKNGKPRTFKAAPAVMECLKGVERQQKERRLKAGAVWDNPLGLVFTNEIGGDIPHITIEHHFARILASAGIGEHRFHDLRHTFTVEGIKAGVDVKTLSAMLGHSSVAFTLDVYGHVTGAMQDEAAQRLQALIIGRTAGN